MAIFIPFYKNGYNFVKNGLISKRKSPLKRWEPLLSACKTRLGVSANWEHYSITFIKFIYHVGIDLRGWKLNNLALNTKIVFLG